jgi:hypothetical protein
MAEVLARFPESIRTARGISYHAQACAAPNADGLWEGWIEFVPDAGGPPLRSPRETTQPNRVDAAYWATGITGVYLEGALARALSAVVPKAAGSPARSLFDEPAPIATHPKRPPSVAGDAILDPFAVYDKGELILRQELGALSAWHLVNIIVAYQLSSEPLVVLNGMAVPELIATIIAQVRKSLG